jgi:hypothetical protein
MTDEKLAKISERGGKSIARLKLLLEIPQNYFQLSSNFLSEKNLRVIVLWKRDWYRFYPISIIPAVPFKPPRRVPFFTAPTIKSNSLEASILLLHLSLVRRVQLRFSRCPFRFNCIKTHKKGRKEEKEFVLLFELRREENRERPWPNKNQWLENQQLCCWRQKKVAGVMMMEEKRELSTVDDDENIMGRRKNYPKEKKGTLIILENKNSRFPLRMTGKCLHVLSVSYASSLPSSFALYAEAERETFFNPADILLMITR